ncbi:acetyltransferase [Vibrio tubiashii]|nr:acetyltransferase [Vibrio tubiashii]
MTISIEPITPQQNEDICRIIKTVGAEFGAIGEGFGPSDPEVEAMSQHYTENNQSLYLVATVDGKIVGGCGLAPFQSSTETCELKKLFLLPESRGLGLGKQLSEQCLKFAQNQGFSHCYLDTLQSMTSAIKLYQSLGFEHLDKPLDGTEHGGCDVWMLKRL